MAEPTSLTPKDYEVWRLASPAQLLSLIKRLGVEQAIIARWLGVKPTAISQWSHGHRPIPPRFAPILLMRAQKSLEDAYSRNVKEMAAAPTDALRQTMQGEFGALWSAWKLEVLYSAGTLQKALHQSYYALGSWTLKERLTADDLESIELLCDSIVTRAKIVFAQQQNSPQTEDALIERLTQAHEDAAQMREERHDA
jgi:DNA-binding transcriptional regulator YdaS (Cro superfamily)